jgi:hypothetical protein
MFGRKTFVAVRGSSFFLANSDRLEIREFSSAGQLRRIIRLQREPYRISIADVERVLDSIAAGRPGSGDAERKQWRGEVSMIATLPAFKAFVVDGSGRFWIREYEPPGIPQGVQQWLVFSSAGELLGRVEAPGDVRVVEIGSDYLLGVRYRESTGVQVVVHRLQGSRPALPPRGGGER